jgi:hypothetical protein
MNESTFVIETRGVSDPIVQALSKSVFRPGADRDKRPLAVKVLIGIPL